MSDDQPKPRFEPPPWERAAFERFQQERARIRAREELNAALREVRGSPVEEKQPEAAANPTTPAQPPADAQSADPIPPPELVPEAKIDAMLIQLRGEEKPNTTVSMRLVNGVIGFMTLSGLYITVQSVLLFAGVRSSDSASTMLAATASFLVFMTGLGFLGAAVMLFRKYHR